MVLSNGGEEELEVMSFRREVGEEGGEEVEVMGREEVEGGEEVEAMRRREEAEASAILLLVL